MPWGGRKGYSGELALTCEAIVALSKHLRASSRLFAGVIALVLVAAAAAPALGTTSRQTQIEQEKSVLREKIRQAERDAKSLSQQIAASDIRRADLEREIASLTRQLREAEERLAEAEVNLSGARDDVFALESSLAASLGRADEARIRLNERTRSAYRSGGGLPYLEMLLASEDFRDFVSRVTFFRRVMDHDRSRLSAIQRLSSLLELNRSEAIQRKDEFTAQKTAIEVEKAKIASLQASLRASRQKVLDEIANRKTLLSKVNADKAGYLRQMALLEAESRSIAALLRSIQKGQVYQAGSGKQLAWPTTGSVSSYFGYRTHPIFGDRRFHAGIDISAPAGQSVIAAESGKVVLAGYKGGYGLVVIIDHGNALATLYAHLQAVNVATGATVGRASRVGSVGCSGYCTGPHLHFETRINGEPRDPMQFF